MNRLDQEEKEIPKAFKRGGFKSVPHKEAKPRRQKEEEYAAATLSKDKCIHVHISACNLKALQLQALIEGIPYRTLVSRILHEYVEGRLVATDL